MQQQLLRRPRQRVLAVLVVGYAAISVLLIAGVQLLTDRVWLATLLAFGPRWLAALPLLPLTFAIGFSARRRQGIALLTCLAVTALALLFGLLDFRMGIARVAAPMTLRLMTQNLGASRVTAQSLDRFMRAQAVDVAALQECPFYDASPNRLGWRFYYGGDLCLVSRFPFAVLGVADPENFWRRGDREPLRFAIDAPDGRFQLLNVHFETIRAGLEALAGRGLAGLPEFRANRQQAMVDARHARAMRGAPAIPLIVAGDFNVPVESAVYRENWADLQNAFSGCGRGFGHSKFTRLFGIRIDHVLTSSGWACREARVVATPYGGDHAALIVDLVRR